MDYDFLGVNTDEAEEHAEAETFEENEEDDADAEETEAEVLFDSEEERKERAERREIRQQERAEREKYSAEQLTMFAMFEEKATWEHIEGSQMLYKVRSLRSFYGIFSKFKQKMMAYFDHKIYTMDLLYSNSKKWDHGR